MVGGYPDTQSTPTTSLNDQLNGSDKWQHADTGNYTQNANGTYTAFDSSTTEGSGGDIYANVNTGNTTTVSPDPGGSTTGAVGW
jgi:hypothetical protein